MVPFIANDVCTLVRMQIKLTVVLILSLLFQYNDISQLHNRGEGEINNFMFFHRTAVLKPEIMVLSR
jgi:hypothetical protein